VIHQTSITPTAESIADVRSPRTTMLRAVERQQQAVTGPQFSCRSTPVAQVARGAPIAYRAGALDSSSGGAYEDASAIRNDSALSSPVPVRRGGSRERNRVDRRPDERHLTLRVRPFGRTDAPLLSSRTSHTTAARAERTGPRDRVMRPSDVTVCVLARDAPIGRPHSDRDN
jgi:hypothetical protein